MAGALSGCGRKEYQQIRSEFGRHSLSIGEELQWESCFEWLYFPQEESTNSVKMGYFKQKENSGKMGQIAKAAVNRAVNTRQDGDTIEVCHDMLSEEEFFALINSCSKELAEKYSEKEVAYRINGSTEIDQFVQLDAGKEHWLYLRVKDSAYILYAEMNNEKWRNFLEEWLFTFDLKWDGLMVMKEDGNVSGTYTGCKMFQCKEGSMNVDGDILLFHAQENGFYFKTESGDDEKRLVEEVVLHPVDICLEYDSWEVAGELLDTITYGVEISDEKGDELLQEIRVDSTFAHESPFQFEDFNADGYLDLTVKYYYGANGGSASHYIFSPSKKEFVELDSELEYYGMYGVDYETRRLYMHYHESAISGTEITYQWKNEMDYEMIKQFHHDSMEDGVQVKIVRYENGKEEVLSDYLYSYEEYLNRGDIWGTYYDGRIFVYDEDTYLVSVGHSEIISKSSSILWEDGDEDKEQALVIHYVDGGEATLYLFGLIRPDYQPASNQEDQGKSY